MIKVNVRELDEVTKKEKLKMPSLPILVHFDNGGYYFICFYRGKFGFVSLDGEYYAMKELLECDYYSLESLFRERSGKRSGNMKVILDADIDVIIKGKAISPQDFLDES